MIGAYKLNQMVKRQLLTLGRTKIYRWETESNYGIYTGLSYNVCFTMWR